MKKVMLLVVTVMLISAFLMASGPSLRMVRLEVINKSGNEVMIKLEGSDIGKQFYYLTIPAGTKEMPNVEVFTVLEDVYTRTTWYGEGDVAQCVGVSSTGTLVMDRNNRLTFTPCYTTSKRTIEAGGDEARVCIEGNKYYDPDWCKELSDTDWWKPCDWGIGGGPWACEFVSNLTAVTNAGEPSQEKVVYSPYFYVSYGLGKDWNWSGSWGSQRCGQLWVGWDTAETEVPNLCMWRYGY